MASPPALNFNLQKLLEQLNSEELATFKCLLKAFCLQNKLTQIPQDEIQEADAKQVAEILDKCCPIMVEKVITHVFTKMKRTDLCERIEEEIQNSNLRPTQQEKPPLLVISCTVGRKCFLMENALEKLKQEKPENKYREVIKKKIEQLWNNNFWPEDNPNMYIVMQRYQTLFPFRHPKNNKMSFLHTVLYGPPGFGKSTLAKKLMLDWTQFNLGQFQCAFYLNCRELAYLPPCTFVELLAHHCPQAQKDISEILSKAERVLFVVDGFDELDVPSGALICDICGDWDVQKPVPILLSSLLKKKMVHNATLLVTTGPSGVRDLLILVDQPRFVEVEGFSGLEKEEYFQRYFEDPQLKRRALGAVSSNATLLAMISAPAVCQLVCACLRPLMQREQALGPACRCATSFFLHLLCGRFPPAPGQDAPGEDAPGHLRAALECLCLLAAQCLWARRLSHFHTRDLERLKLTESHLRPFLDKGLVQRDADCQGCFSFAHLSVQQFLAACFYILKLQEPGRLDAALQDIGDARRLLSREARAQNPSLTQAGRFLFGLLNKERARELEAAFGCQTSLEVQWDLLGCGAGQQPPLSTMDLRELFYCVYESGEKELARAALAPLEDVTLHVHGGEDVKHAAFCLAHCQNLQSLSLQVAQGVFLDDSAPLDSYEPDGRSQEYENLLSLWTDLCSVLCSKKTLISMDLSQSFLNTLSMRILCEQIAHAPPKFQKVVLKSVHPASAYHNLCLTFRGYETLTHLILQVYNHSAVLPSLQEILTHPKCKLVYLRLGPGSATTEQWADFFLALQANQSLTCLDLSDSELKDEGVKLLCETLKHPKCQLQKLLLANCQLTEACCKALTAILIVNQSLTHLCLSKNELGDTGVKILCEGLSYPECKLQYLMLWLCGVTATGCGYLCKVLRLESSLTLLDLGLNRIGIRGVRSLCKALEEPLCDLKHLGLWGCAITPVSCREIASALSKNQSLLTLDLGQNSLGFDGVKTVCEPLKLKSNTLEALRLKIDEFDPNFQKLLQEIKESRPQLMIESDYRNPRKRRPSSQDFVF